MGSGNVQQRSEGEYYAEVKVQSLLGDGNWWLSLAGDPWERRGGGERERWSEGASKGEETEVSSKVSSQVKLAMQTVDQTMREWGECRDIGCLSSGDWD